MDWAIVGILLANTGLLFWVGYRLGSLNQRVNSIDYRLGDLDESVKSLGDRFKLVEATCPLFSSANPEAKDSKVK